MIRAMGTPADPSLRDEQVERTRERILDAAVTLLADESFAELTVPLVAKRAGVAVRTVYRYFPSRAALIDAVAVLADGRFGPTPFPQASRSCAGTHPACSSTSRRTRS